MGLRRTFIKGIVSSSVFPVRSLLANGLADTRPIQLGLIADLHQDLVHDAQDRLDGFVQSAKGKMLDALIQLGDFATPIAKNRKVIETFNAAHAVPLHVIGNHDTDGGLKSAQVVDVWGMKNRFYSIELRGMKIITLDGNDRPLSHRSGYPAHIADNQLEWLVGELKHPGPMIILCHQPLAGPSSIDNAQAVRRLLAAHADRILLVINGHTHIDELLEMDGIHFWHVNSAAYYWMGSNYKHESYSPEIHAKFPSQSSTCPYREALFSFLELDLSTGSVTITGRQSLWVGATPAELGLANVTGTGNRQTDRSRDPFTKLEASKALTSQDGKQNPFELASMVAWFGYQIEIAPSRKD